MEGNEVEKAAEKHNDYSIEAHRRELFKLWSEGKGVKTWDSFLISTIANAVDDIQSLQSELTRANAQLDAMTTKYNELSRKYDDLYRKHKPL